MCFVFVRFQTDQEPTCTAGYVMIDLPLLPYSIFHMIYHIPLTFLLYHVHVLIIFHQKVTFFDKFVKFFGNLLKLRLSWQHIIFCSGRLRAFFRLQKFENSKTVLINNVSSQVLSHVHSYVLKNWINLLVLMEYCYNVLNILFIFSIENVRITMQSKLVIENRLFKMANRVQTRTENE